MNNNNDKEKGVLLFIVTTIDVESDPASHHWLTLQIAVGSVSVYNAIML